MTVFRTWPECVRVVQHWQSRITFLSLNREVGGVCDTCKAKLTSSSWTFSVILLFFSSLPFPTASRACTNHNQPGSKTRYTIKNSTLSFLPWAPANRAVSLFCTVSERQYHCTMLLVHQVYHSTVPLTIFYATLSSTMTKKDADHSFASSCSKDQGQGGRMGACEGSHGWEIYPNVTGQHTGLASRFCVQNGFVISALTWSLRSPKMATTAATLCGTKQVCLQSATYAAVTWRMEAWKQGESHMSCFNSEWVSEWEAAVVCEVWGVRWGGRRNLACTKEASFCLPLSCRTVEHRTICTATLWRNEGRLGRHEVLRLRLRQFRTCWCCGRLWMVCTTADLNVVDRAAAMCPIWTCHRIPRFRNNRIFVDLLPSYQAYDVRLTGIRISTGAGFSVSRLAFACHLSLKNLESRPGCVGKGERDSELF